MSNGKNKPAEAAVQIPLETRTLITRLEHDVGTPAPVQNEAQFKIYLVPVTQQNMAVFGEQGEDFSHSLFISVQQNDLVAVHTGIRMLELSETARGPQALQLAEAVRDYVAQNYDSALEHLLVASGINPNVYRNATRGWSAEQQIDFANFVVDKVDMDYFKQASYEEQLRTVGYILDQYARSRGIEIGQAQRQDIVVGMVTAMSGELRMADRGTMDNIYAANDLQGLLSAATFLTFRDREGLENFMAGPVEGPIPASPAEQFAAMLDAYFEISKQEEESFRKTKEEKEAEKLADEMQTLSGEAEEIKQRFIEKLKEMGDVGGLAALADGFEGDGMSHAEWHTFWTEERRDAFRGALKNA